MARYTMDHGPPDSCAVTAFPFIAAADPADC